MELERTNAWSYSVGNLTGLMTLARMGERFDVDIWSYRTDDGRSLRKAIDFLLPFGLCQREWEYQQISGWSANAFYPLLRTAAEKYSNGPYRSLLANIPSEPSASRSLLLQPRLHIAPQPTAIE